MIGVSATTLLLLVVGHLETYPNGGTFLEMLSLVKAVKSPWDNQAGKLTHCGHLVDALSP